MTGRHVPIPVESDPYSSLVSFEEVTANVNLQMALLAAAERARDVAWGHEITGVTDTPTEPELNFIFSRRHGITARDLNDLGQLGEMVGDATFITPVPAWRD